MANIVVLPTIEVSNPFGVLAEILGNQVIPFIAELSRSKEQIALFSDKELTDHIPVLKRFASDLLTQDDKIYWNKVEEYAKSEDPFKQEVASYLNNVRKMREEFANLPIGEKLEKLGFYATATNPKILEKSFKVKVITEKYNEALDKADIPEELKLLFRAHAPELAEKIAERPELFSSYIKLLENISKKKQGDTQQGGGTGSWRLSLDGQNKKQFGIRLEEPQLTPPQVSPPQIPKVVAPQPASPQAPKKSVVSGSQTGNIGREGQVKQDNKTKSTKDQKPQNEPVMTFWRDGVLWEMRRGKDGKVEYIPREAPLVEQDIDPLTVSFLPNLLSRAGGFVSKVFGRGVSKIMGRGAQKSAEKVAENVAKETTEKAASEQAVSGAQNVAGQKSKYDAKREEVRKKIEEQLKKKIPANEWRFAYKKPPVEKEFEVVSIKDLKEKTRQKKLPTLAPKETRWEFANAKPPAVIFREKGVMEDYVPPQFERLFATRLKELARQKNLPKLLSEGEITKTIKPLPKETPYKEEVARQGLKTSQKLEEFLKKLGAEPKRVETKETVLNPIKKLENLIKEIPDEAKQDPDIRRKLVEITRDLKKISQEAPFRDASKDLKTLDTKVEELKTLLKERYSKTGHSSEKPAPKTKKKQSNK